jgi:two-component system NtrC family sensor kinase
VLAFAGRQGLQAETVDLNGVLLGLRRRLGDMPGTTAMVELALHPEPLLAVVDPGQLELAIINLVRNAADASPPGSRIVVAASVQHDDDVAAAKIAVIDTGCGMSPEITAKALDPFFTTKKHGKGTGLGLSMVAGFCRESGGRMSIQSNAGTGTMVSLAFPLAKS